jgi:hypothetical protein
MESKTATGIVTIGVGLALTWFNLYYMFAKFVPYQAERVVLSHVAVVETFPSDRSIADYVQKEIDLFEKEEGINEIDICSNLFYSGLGLIIVAAGGLMVKYSGSCLSREYGRRRLSGFDPATIRRNRGYTTR